MLPDLPALAELRSRPQWVAWRYLERDGNLTKPPVNPHNGYGASHSDPATWGTYEEALARAQADNLAGVGYVISEDDNLTGADLDSCRDPNTGNIEPWAQELIDFAETYTEISPSGRGLRLIWRGKIDKTIKCDPAHVEVYRNKRFLTITGNHISRTPAEIRPAPRIEAALRQRAASMRAREVEPPPPRAGGIIARSLNMLGGSATPTTGASFFRSINGAALANLDKWVPALLGSMAEYQPGTGAWRISSKTLGRSLQEDLSIAPTGIVDFGVADMGDPRLGKRTPIDLVLEFGAQRTAADAALWLCDAISVKAESLGWKGAARPNEAPSGSVAIEAPASRTIKTVDFATLMTENPVEEPDYIEPDFAGPGGFVLIAGPPKAQKSFLLQEALVAAATGQTFLAGTFRTPRPLRVFYLQAEMNRKLLRKRARMIAAGMTPTHQELLRKNLIVSERFFMILNVHGVGMAVNTIRSAFPNDPPDIIAIDPMANLFDAENESDNAQVMRFLTGRVEAVRQAINPLACIFMAHHSTKKSTEDLARDPFVAIRGASALRGYYDSAIVIFRKDEESKARRVHFELRGGESPEPLTVNLVNGRFQKWDETEEIPLEMGRAILNRIDYCWRKGEPLSDRRNTPYARQLPRALVRQFSQYSADQIKRLLERWQDNEIIVMEEMSKKKSLWGFKKLRDI